MFNSVWGITTSFIWGKDGMKISVQILFSVINLINLNVGQLTIWTPYLIMFFAVVEIPIWIILTIDSHEKHVAN